MKLYDKFIAILLVCLIFIFISTGIAVSQGKPSIIRLRLPVDTVGFASHAWQMDSVMSRIPRLNRNAEGKNGNHTGADSRTIQKAAICPHDDYVYAGWLYPEVLKSIHA